VHGKEWISYCEEEYDFHKLFDVIEYSFESQILKPNPDAFYNVLKKLNAKPEECLFIGDNIQNIDAARKIGIPSILFTDAHALRDDLGKILESFNSKL